MPNKPDSEPTEASEDSASEQRVDVTVNSKTAPQVPEKLLKQIDNQKSEPDPTAEPETVITPSADQPIDSPASGLSNTATDKAVDDIVANEGDTVLAVEDAARQSPLKLNQSSWRAKLSQIAKNKWTWAGVAVVLLIIFALPLTRYKILGLVLKEPVTVTITDSKTRTPVSSVAVSVGGRSAKTDADGRAKLSVPVGNKTLTITKQYYKKSTTKLHIGLKATVVSVQLVATGRQVPITVLNRITGQPLANAEIKVLDTTAKTNAKGQANIVLPTTTTTDKASIALSDYNTAQVTVQVTGSVVSGNMFELTPSGHVYFLSNLSGKIDIVETNLDGSDRQTILAGTGQEDTNTTSLLASRDWRFLVLKSQRSGSQPALYLIDTNTNKLTEFDSSNANFNLIGWDGHDFLYDSQSSSTPQSAAGHEVIKSYDADTLQLNQLDQNQVQGTAASYGYQTFNNFYIVSNALVYTTQWYTYNSTGGVDLSSQTDSIRGVQPGGQNKKDYQTFSATNTSSIQASLYEPQTVYYSIYNSDGSTTYYSLTNQSVSTASLNQNDFNQPYPTYLLSPSGNQTFWTELRDGKNTLFVGDANASNSKQIASLSDYSPYGWYGDSYVLVSQNSSELYIMPAGGLASGQQPLKITDYYKPAQNFNGYGYGYGGL